MTDGEGKADTSGRSLACASRWHTLSTYKSLPDLPMRTRSMISLASTARAHSNTALTSACNAALRALKQGPHSGVLLVAEEGSGDGSASGEDGDGEGEGGAHGSPRPIANRPYINRCVCVHGLACAWGWGCSSDVMAFRAQGALPCNVDAWF